MAITVEMPKLGNTVEECLIASWKKNVGDLVSKGEIIADIETDKATFELAAPVDGTLLATFFDEGVLIPVFATICIIGSPGEDVEQFSPWSRQSCLQRRQSCRRFPPAAEIPFSPRARKYARDHGSSLPAIPGSGPGGRVLEQDLRDLYAARDWTRLRPVCRGFAPESRSACASLWPAPRSTP